MQIPYKILLHLVGIVVRIGVTLASHMRVDAGGIMKHRHLCVVHGMII